MRCRPSLLAWSWDVYHQACPVPSIRPSRPGLHMSTLCTVKSRCEEELFSNASQATRAQTCLRADPGARAVNASARPASDSTAITRTCCASSVFRAAWPASQPGSPPPPGFGCRHSGNCLRTERTSAMTGQKHCRAVHPDACIESRLAVRNRPRAPVRKTAGLTS